MAKKQFGIGYVFTGDGSSLQGAIEQIGRTMNGFTKGALGTFLTRTLSIGGALLVAEKAMKSTEKGADTLEAATATVSGAFQGFFRTITSGEPMWGNLTDNIIRTAKATRDLAIAKDELGDIEASNTVRVGFLDRSLQSAKLAAAGTTNPAEKKRYIDEAIGIQKSITAIQVEEIGKQLKIVEDFWQTREDWSDERTKKEVEQIRRLAGNYEYFFGENSVVRETMGARLTSLNYFAGGRKLTKGELFEKDEIERLIGSMEIFKELQDSMKPDEFQNYIKTIGDYNAAIAEGDQNLIRLTKSLTTADKAADKFDKQTSAGLEDKFYVFSILKKPGLKKNANESVEETNTTIEGQIELVNELSDTFEKMFTNVGGGFKGMVNSMMDSLKMLLAQLIAKAAIFGILQLILPGSGLAARALTGLKSFVGIPGFASGTNYAPGGLSLVGERGPELVNLPRGSQVIPNGGFGGGEFTFKISGKDLVTAIRRNGV